MLAQPGRWLDGMVSGTNGVYLRDIVFITECLLAMEPTEKHGIFTNNVLVFRGHLSL